MRLARRGLDFLCKLILSGAAKCGQHFFREPILKVPRPFAPPGDENNSSGPEPSELSPAQIKAKLETDPVLWNAKIEALRNVGLEVLEIVKKRNTAELWDAADNLDRACEACHLQYWYPGDPALLEKVDRQLEELYGRPSKAGK